jgi:hypothetical protein
LIVKRRGEDFGNQNRAVLSTFQAFQAGSYQTKIGSARFPEYPDDSFARMWATTAKS